MLTVQIRRFASRLYDEVKKKKKKKRKKKKKERVKNSYREKQNRYILIAIILVKIQLIWILNNL